MLVFLGLFAFLFWKPIDSETLFIQKIEGSDMLIVDYDVWYGMDGNASGMTLLKSPKHFSLRGIEYLPIVYLENVSSKQINGITLIRSEPSENELKWRLKNKTVKIKNITVNTNWYRAFPYSGPCRYATYKFSSFLETKDSLFLFRSVEEFADSQIVDSKFAFKKGNIKIYSDSIGRVRSLEIKELLLKQRVEKIQDSSNLNDPSKLVNACLHEYVFETDSVIYENEFSDYGFFKMAK